MKKIASKIKQDIEKFDPSLFEQIQLANMEDDYLILNSSKIYRHLNDCNNPNLDERLLLVVKDQKLVVRKSFSFEYQKQQAKQMIIDNFILNYGYNHFKGQSINDNITSLIEEKKLSNNNNPYSFLIKTLTLVQKASNKLPFKSNFIYLSSTHNNLITNYFFSIMEHFALQDKSYGAILMSLLFADMKLSFNNEKSNYNLSVFERAKSVDLLFLDDLSPFFMKEWFLTGFLVPLLNYRKKNNLVTFISSKESLETFATKLKNTQKQTPFALIEETMSLLQSFNNLNLDT